MENVSTIICGSLTLSPWYTVFTAGIVSHPRFASSPIITDRFRKKHVLHLFKYKDLLRLPGLYLCKLNNHFEQTADSY